MKSKLLLFALLLMRVSVGAQTASVSISDDCSKNGVSKVVAITGSAAVTGTSGRTSCEWVQLWENGPKWATFNVGATITNYANLTVGAEATEYYNWRDQAPYYNTANVGGLYAWNQPNYNGRQTTWTSSVTTGVVADVATTLWGSNWKTPTREQLDTLQDSRRGKTTWTWCDGSSTQYVPGCTLAGFKVSGVGAYASKSIFLPAAGHFDYIVGWVSTASRNGDYWSSTEGDSNRICGMGFLYSDRRMTDRYTRETGHSVRAVLVETNLSESQTSSTSNDTLTLYADGCNEPNTFICQEGLELSVRATPMEHRHFVAWNDGKTNNPRVVTMNQNLTYTATFAPDSFNISVAASPTSYGSVSGTGRYEYNSSARLTATANYGYHFSQWNDSSTNNPRLITVTKNETYTAYFEPNAYVINLSTSGNGGKVSGQTSGKYLDEMTITATPDLGYHFTQWSDGNTENPRKFVLTKDTAFAAAFAITYSDSCGNNMDWQYSDGTLSISGYGAMYDYSSNTAPWILFRDSITSLTISEGITSIGDYAFYGCTWLADIYCYATVPPTARTNNTFNEVNQHCYIHIPAGTIRAYQMAPGWSRFLHFYEISKLPEGTPTDSVGVTVTGNYATFTWPVNPTANSYTLTITKNGEVFCILTFNSLGQLVGMAFAPSRNGAARAAEQTAYGYAFVVSGLDEGSTYHFTFTSLDSQNNILTEETGSFIVKVNPGQTTALDAVNTGVDTPTKFLRDGQILIRRGTTTYNLRGQVVK